MNTLQRDDGEHYLPSAYRQQFAIRIPDQLLPYIGRTPDPNITTVVKNLDFPAVDVLSLMAFSNGGLDVSETLGNLAQQSHPLARTLVELASDTDLYSKRPLRESPLWTGRIRHCSAPSAACRQRRRLWFRTSPVFNASSA
jgi:hypothetical protein